jgi:hypothetical protein
VPKEGPFCFQLALVNDCGSPLTILLFRSGVNYFRDKFQWQWQGMKTSGVSMPHVSRYRAAAEDKTIESLSMVNFIQTPSA